MTKRVMCGDVQIGGGAPVSIQSMCNTDTYDIKATTDQVIRLADAGCEIVRITVPKVDAAEAFGTVKKNVRAAGYNIPFVADIHFDYRCALAAIENGADKIRINPGNIGSADRVLAVVNKAKEYGIPIRIGVNSGSLEKDIIAKNGGVTAEGLAESAARNIRLLEDMDFDDIVVSLKSSDIVMNYKAHKLISAMTDHPLHIGLTEAGTPEIGMRKSAIALGALLLEGIGDTMRISLTGDPVPEVIFAKELLKDIGLRKGGIKFVSCPTCGRTKVNLPAIAEEVEHALREVGERRDRSGKRPITVAVMGCAVNGPGEAREADLGAACGEGKAVIFAKGEIIKTVKEEELASCIIELAENI